MIGCIESFANKTKQFCPPTSGHTSGRPSSKGSPGRFWPLFILKTCFQFQVGSEKEERRGALRNGGHRITIAMPSGSQAGDEAVNPQTDCFFSHT